MMEREDRPKTNLAKQVVCIDARHNSITVSWPAEERAIRYVLEYRLVQEGENPELDHLANFERLSETIQGTETLKKNLEPETEYFFRVAPVFPPKKVTGKKTQKSVMGPWIIHKDPFETLSQEQDEDFAMAPPIVTVPAELDSLIITWEEIDEEIYGFELQMREDKGGAKWFGFQLGNENETQKRNLTSKYGYQFRVRPITDYEEPFSPPSERVFPRRPFKYGVAAHHQQQQQRQQHYPRQEEPPTPEERERQQEEWEEDEKQWYYDEETANKPKPTRAAPAPAPTQAAAAAKDSGAMPAPWFKTAGPGSVLVCWQPQEGTYNGYELQMKELAESGGGDNAPWTTIGARIKGTQVKKNNLTTNDFGYQFRVKPLDGPMSQMGYSNPSNPVILPKSSSRSSHAAATRNPTRNNLKRTPSGKTYSMPAPWFKSAQEKHAILVCWQPQGDDVSGYELQMREVAHGEVFATIAKKISGTEVKKKNLTSMNGYQFRVRPVDGPNKHKGFSAPSSTAIAQ